MFTYTLSDKAIENGQLRVTVDYTNGQVKFSETFLVTAKDELDNRIDTTLKRLQKVVDLEKTVAVGGYIKAEKPPVEEKQPTAFETAEAKLYEYKHLIDLGVMKETDAEYLAAITVYKTELNKR